MTDTERQVPKILYQGKKYLVLFKLKQMRNVNNPTDCIYY
jgi:hypothetical protein